MAVTDEIHRVTVDEYLHIVHGLGWERTELIDGVVYDVPPVFNRKADVVRSVFWRLDEFIVGDLVWCAGSVRVSDRSLFDPDVSVIDGAAYLDPDDFVPVAAVKLVVEVSVSTQSRDRGAKLIAYAKGGVPEVWLIDPRPGLGELIRHRDPDGASYATVDRFAVGEDAADLDVATMLAR